MAKKEFKSLSEKINVRHKVGEDLLPVIDIKEFIKRLKESFKGSMMESLAIRKIDKLSGPKLITKS